MTHSWSFQDKVDKAHGKKSWKHHHYTDEELFKMYDLYQSGKTTRQLGEMYEVSKTTIQRCIKRIGGKLRSEGYKGYTQRRLLLKEAKGGFKIKSSFKLKPKEV